MRETMTIRWGYAIDQWKPQFDDFVRRRDHERALKTIAVAGFAGVQLTSGTGRWQPLGNSTQIEANFGSLEGFADFVRSCALDGVAAFVFDPTQGFHEDLSHGADPRQRDDRDAVITKALWFADAVSRTGGDVLVASRRCGWLTAGTGCWARSIRSTSVSPWTPVSSRQPAGTHWPRSSRARCRSGT